MKQQLNTSVQNALTANKRFCASGGSYPAESAVEAAAPPSRRSVTGKLMDS